jgi:polyphosphate kinase 2 (PPK2 family)
VLVVRVHNLVPKSDWSKRYAQINDFERMLSENGTHILKFFLIISKQEQAERLAARLEDPQKNWKFSADDTKERSYWDDYITAYEDVLRKCSTDYAPWHIVPSDRKWFRNLAVAQILRDELRRMKLQYPKRSA